MILVYWLSSSGVTATNQRYGPTRVAMRWESSIEGRTYGVSSLFRRDLAERLDGVSNSREGARLVR